MPFDHIDIAEVNDDLTGIEDSTEIVERLYELISKLDTAYDEISQDIEDQSHKMIIELFTLFNQELIEKLLPIMLEDASFSDFYIDVIALFHILLDFKVDGMIDNDLFTDIWGYKTLRRERIKEINASIPEINIYPNPVSNELNIDIDLKYDFLKDNSSSTLQLIWTWTWENIPEFNPYDWLPDIIEKSFDWSQNSGASPNSISVDIYNLSGALILRSTPMLDIHWNVKISENVSNLPAGQYVVKTVVPSMWWALSTYGEIDNDETNWVYTQSFIKM